MQTTTPIAASVPRVDTNLGKFSQGCTVVLTALAFLLNQPMVLGWTLDLIVFVLAGINLTVGFCAGCFVYYHLGRLGVLPRVRYAGSFHWRGV